MKKLKYELNLTTMELFGWLRIYMVSPGVTQN